MSLASADAIAHFGDTLLAILRDGLTGLVLPANVQLSTPSEFKTFAPLQPAVTVFLYHVSMHGEMRNAPRHMLSNGTVLGPPLPLELRLLITPWTQVTRDAYRIIGSIAQVLHDHAVLGFGELLGDDVWMPDDTVELILESLSVEEHYDIWEPTDIPYRLSLAYLARLIGIDSTLGKGGPPVVLATLPRVTPP
jgi:Pvc16 N-terminal domain